MRGPRRPVPDSAHGHPPNGPSAGRSCRRSTSATHGVIATAPAGKRRDDTRFGRASRNDHVNVCEIRARRRMMGGETWPMLKKSRTAYFRCRASRYRVSPERQREIFPPIVEGEDPYLALARQMDLAKPWELAALAMMRHGDAGQIRAMELILVAKYTRLTRLAVIAAVLSAAAATIAIAIQVA